MTVSIGRALAIAAVLNAAIVWAQQPPAGVPTTVQLPTFSYFRVETSVSIPDSGGAYSEAAQRARQSKNFPGLRPAGAGLGGTAWGRSGRAGQGRGRELGAAGVTAHSTIHPTAEEMDAAPPARIADSFAEKLHAARESSAGRPAMSVIEARRLRLAENSRNKATARQLVRQGDDAREQGNRAAAKVYYKSAERTSAGSAAAKAAMRLKSLTDDPGRE